MGVELTHNKEEIPLQPYYTQCNAGQTVVIQFLLAQTLGDIS